MVANENIIAEYIVAQRLTVPKKSLLALRIYDGKRPSQSCS